MHPPFLHFWGRAIQTLGLQQARLPTSGEGKPNAVAYLALQLVYRVVGVLWRCILFPLGYLLALALILGLLVLTGEKLIRREFNWSFKHPGLIDDY